MVIYIVEINLLSELIGDTMINETTAKWLTNNKINGLKSRCILRNTFYKGYEDFYNHINEENPLYNSHLKARLKRYFANETTGHGALTLMVLRGDIIVDRDGYNIVFFSKEKYTDKDNLTIPVKSVLLFNKIVEI